MSRPRQRAHVRKWRGKYYLINWDPNTDKERRRSCEALDARNDDERRELVNKIRREEDQARAEIARRGGKLAYETKLFDAFDRFKEFLDEQEKLRAANPEAREGLSPKSVVEYKADLDKLIQWLSGNGYGHITTGELDGPTLGKFSAFLASEKLKRGKRTFVRRSASLNKVRRSIKTCLGYLNRIRPPLFPDFDNLKDSLKPSKRQDKDPPQAFTPAELRAFLRAAIAYEDPEKKSTVERSKQGGRREYFVQKLPSPATPVSRLFLLIALTGARLDEALSLRWEDCVLETGRITIRSQKTGHQRMLPLIRAPECDVAPKFLELLRRWRKERPEAEYVLPHKDIPKPAFPKSGWQIVAKRSKVHLIGPQALRQNFTSYSGSLAVPNTTEALWLGHSVQIAERFYRAQILDRIDSETFEGAMGLDTEIDKLLKKSA